MSDSINGYRTNAAEKLSREQEDAERAELSIEFLQELIRQSLAEFVTALFPRLEYREARRLVQQVVAIRTPRLSVDTLLLAEQLLESSGPDWRSRLKEISSKLFACTEKVIAGFLQFVEKAGASQKIMDEALSTESLLSSSTIDLEILGRFGESRGALDGTMEQDKPLTKELSIPLEGKRWTVAINGYPGENLKALSKKEALLVAVKKKIEHLQKELTPRLRAMARLVKEQGPKSPLSFEVKPFLKGAIEKFKYVESLAATTFSRIAGDGMTETSSEQMLQTLSLELQSLERYIFKLEKIFEKASQKILSPETLASTKGVRLSDEDTALLPGMISQDDAAEGSSSDSIRSAMEDISLDDTFQIDPRTFHRDIDWSIKENEKEPVMLDSAEGAVTERPIVENIPEQAPKKKNVFARMFGTLLNPQREFENTERRVTAVAGNTETEYHSKKDAKSVDVLLPSFDPADRSRQQQHKRKVYHHRFIF